MRFTLATSIVTLAVLAAATPQPVGPNVGLTIPITKRSGLTRADKSVDIEALKAHAASTKAKVLRGLNNFRRNTGAPHPAAAKGAQKRDTGSEALTDASDQLWYGNVDVGTSPVTFTVSFDTGSSDFFIPSVSCSNCGSHTRYDPSASSTSVDLGKTFSLHMGDKSTVSGEQYSDTVTVAGLTATDQTLGSATQYSSSFQNGPADGSMGMAFPSLSSYPATPFFNTLISEGVVSAGQFAFKLAESGSSLFLGGADPSLYTGSINWNPVTQQGYWQIALDAVSVGSSQPVTGVESIIDTGTALIAGDPSSVAAFYAALPGSKDASKTVGSGFYTFPCDSSPDVSLTFGGISYPISSKDFNLGQVSHGSSDCVGGIVAQDAASSFWVIGDVFLRNVYTVFDFDNSQVGFAALA